MTARKPVTQGSEYDRRAQAWVRLRFGVTPDLGSVEFDNDCAAYASGGWANANVSWTVDGSYGGSELSSSAWQFSWTEIIRELVEIDLELGTDNEEGES